MRPIQIILTITLIFAVFGPFQNIWTLDHTFTIHYVSAEDYHLVNSPLIIARRRTFNSIIDLRDGQTQVQLTKNTFDHANFKTGLKQPRSVFVAAISAEHQPNQLSVMSPVTNVFTTTTTQTISNMTVYSTTTDSTSYTTSVDGRNPVGYVALSPLCPHANFTVRVTRNTQRISGVISSNQPINFFILSLAQFQSMPRGQCGAAENASILSKNHVTSYSLDWQPQPGDYVFVFANIHDTQVTISATIFIIEVNGTTLPIMTTLTITHSIETTYSNTTAHTEPTSSFSSIQFNPIPFTILMVLAAVVIATLMRINWKKRNQDVKPMTWSSKSDELRPVELLDRIRMLDELKISDKIDDEVYWKLRREYSEKLPKE